MAQLKLLHVPTLFTGKKDNYVDIVVVFGPSDNYDNDSAAG
jgi:hypothetical protein